MAFEAANEDDALLAIVGIGRGRGRGRGRGGPPRGAARAPVVPLLDGPDGDPDGLGAIIGIAHNAPQHRVVFEQRSEALVQHARDVRDVHIARRRAEKERTKRQKLQEATTAAASAFPVVAKTLGLEMQREPMDEKRVEIVSRLSFAATVRNSPVFSVIQVAAMSVMVGALRAKMADFRDAITSPPTPTHAAPAVGAVIPPCLRTYRMLMLNGEWDETSQRIKNMVCDRLKRPNEVVSGRQVAAQLMMMTFDMLLVVGGTVVKSAPWLVRGTVLALQTADYLLEALLRFFFRGH